MKRLLHRLGSAFALFLSIFLMPVPSTAQMQTPGVTQITGTVLDTQRRPVADAQVKLSGPASRTTSTASDGSFAFLSIPSGVYRLNISRGGFNTAAQDDIVTVAGSTTSLTFTLASASLTSLTIIGNVSVSARNSANTINTTPASIVDVPASTFSDQGQLSVNQVLNEEPGITVGVTGSEISGILGNNGASPLATGIPSIRGGLPYETESLIDGHAVSLGENGTFSPSFISPYLLQNVEVVKGPGATSPSINYAVNGTVNYRTLEPTVKPEESVDFGEDQYGGNFANFRLTGTLPGSRLSYAFDYVTQGTEGFERGFTSPYCLATPGPPAIINGMTLEPFAGQALYAGKPGTYQSLSVTFPYFVCCGDDPQSVNQRNELGKLRYAFTPSTVLTVTYLGGQTAGDIGNASALTYDYISFAPPVGYNGPAPDGGTTLYPMYGTCAKGVVVQENTNLFETEFHMPLGKTATLLLRQYSSSIQTYQGPGSTDFGQVTTTETLFGGVYLGSSSTPTFFYGQPATVTYTQGTEGANRTINDLNGFTAEIDKQAGDNLLSLSYDEEKTSTYAYTVCGGVFTVSVPQGSSQTFQSLMGRVQFELSQRVDGTMSDNFGSYTDTYTQDGGASFQQSTHTYQAPRLSLTWRPNANQSIRMAAGVSIAPPYIALLNNDALVSAYSLVPPKFQTTGTSGDVLPETAFGYDLGMDSRLHSPYTVLSVDLYQTILHNQFLQNTFQDGTYTCTSTGGCTCYDLYGQTAPLYVTATENLGHSEYEGVEVSLHRTPPLGWGYRIQGSLQRAFSYDLPAGIYNATGCTLCSNLAILPNINFQGGTFFGPSGMSYSRVPYSTGYGEINYRGRNGAYFLAGITYYGPNNSYDEPAFGVVTLSFTQPITRHASLQLSIYNLTNAYSRSYVLPGANGYPNGAIFTPLANGLAGGAVANVIGPSVARLTLHMDL